MWWGVITRPPAAPVVHYAAALHTPFACVVCCRGPIQRHPGENITKGALWVAVSRTGAVSALHRLLHQPRILRDTMGTAGLPFRCQVATPGLDQTLLKVVWLRCPLRILQPHAPARHLCVSPGDWWRVRACAHSPAAFCHHAVNHRIILMQGAVRIIPQQPAHWRQQGGQLKRRQQG